MGFHHQFGQSIPSGVTLALWYAFVTFRFCVTHVVMYGKHRGLFYYYYRNNICISSEIQEMALHL